jgi:phosphoserine phosphatase RsbU/P
MNPHQEMFAQRGLLESVATMEDADAAEVVRNLHAKIRKFAEGAPQSDDIAVLALKYRGKN